MTCALWSCESETVHDNPCPLTHHVVDGVVDGLDALLLPLVLALPPVHHVVDVHRPVEELRPQPLQEHRVGVLARQVGHDGRARRAHVRHHEERLGGLPLVLEGVGADPDLVLGVRLCGETGGTINNSRFVFASESESSAKAAADAEARLRLGIAFIKPPLLLLSRRPTRSQSRPSRLPISAPS